MIAKKLPSTAIGRRRLLKLAMLLERDAKNRKGAKFDLGEWARPDDDDADTPGFEPALKCNTAACAVGVACLSGAFEKQGLKYSVQFSRLEPKFKRSEGWGAVAKFFELKLSRDWFGDCDSPEAMFLFSGESYPDSLRKGAKGERAVAKRIRDFCTGKAAPSQS